MSAKNDPLKLAAGAPLADSPSLAPAMPRSAPNRQICFVIDDEPGIQNIVGTAAEGLGFHVERFRSAAKALAALNQMTPHLVFLDVSLEGSDAIDVIRGLGSAGFQGTVQLMSGKDPLTLGEVNRVGERHLLTMRAPLRKPFRLEDVRGAIRTFLETEPVVKPVLQNKAAAAKEANRIDVEAMLRNKWLEVWYQPKISLKEMRFAGAEALVRCRHPEKGLLPPAAFLPYADECLMIRLTETVLLTALADWEKFAQVGFPFRLAVNVPVNVFAKLPIHTIVRERRPKTQNWPGMILEVTEDQAIGDIEKMHEIATQLRIHNILLSIDDFGTGYSQLARLKELPFAELKLDRSLVTKCDTDKHNASLCQAAIDLAHRFGSKAVAEGIETAQELKTLIQMGCDKGQGYLFSKPLPRDQLISSLVKNATARA